MFIRASEVGETESIYWAQIHLNPWFYPAHPQNPSLQVVEIDSVTNGFCNGFFLLTRCYRVTGSRKKPLIPVNNPRVPDSRHNIIAISTYNLITTVIQYE